MTNEQTATTTATQMQQVKAKQDKGKESREWGKERGAKELAMQSDAITCQSAHTCTENAAEQQQSLAEAAQLA